MKVVTLMAKVDVEKCNGCRTCERVCPTLAVKVVDKKSVVDPSLCRGCGNCEQRCEQYAITMIRRDEPLKVGVDPGSVPKEKIEKLCADARFNPEQILCYCTETRAEEVAAAIITGADSPEAVSRMTGIRTGCKVECIQPILRMLEAAGIKLVPPEKGYQWYGRTPTVWEIPAEVKAKYSSRGFYFDDDINLLTEVGNAKGGEK